MKALFMSHKCHCYNPGLIAKQMICNKGFKALRIKLQLGRELHPQQKQEPAALLAYYISGGGEEGCCNVLLGWRKKNVWK